MTYLGYNIFEFLFLRLDFDTNLEHCKFCMDIFFFYFSCSLTKNFPWSSLKLPWDGKNHFHLSTTRFGYLAFETICIASA